MKTGTDFYLATGVIRVKESNLISSEALFRMIDAKNASDAFSVLSEFDYSDELIMVDNPDSYEKVLHHDLLQTKDFLGELTSDQNVFLMVFAEFDIHNLKIIFKQKFFDIDLTTHLSHLSVYDPEVLKGFVSDAQAVVAFSKESAMEKVIREAEVYGAENEDLTAEALDVFLDKQLYELLTDVSKKLRSPLLEDIIKKKVDLANVKIMGRARILDKGFDFIEKRLIGNGYIDLEHFKDRFEAEDSTVFYEEISKHFTEWSGQGWAIDHIVFDIFESETLFDLEMAYEKYEVLLARIAKAKPVGIEVLFGYMLGKLIANRNIRKVMSGKLNEVAPEEIKKHVTELV